MKKILDYVKRKYDVEKLQDPPNSTSKNFKVHGHKGSFGIIAAYTRTFCGSCNRIRVTPQGGLRTCLYAHGGSSLRDIIRSNASDIELASALKKAVGTRAKDGFEAEKAREKGAPVSESMATIGG